MMIERYLVLFEIGNKDRENTFLCILKKLGRWCRISGHAFVVESALGKASKVRDIVSAPLANGDRLFVADITDSEWASLSIPRVVTNWLNE